MGLAPRSRAPFPSIGHSGFYTEKTPPRIAGLRIKRPMVDVREFDSRMFKNFHGGKPSSLYCSPYSWWDYSSHDATLPSDNRRFPGPRPKNAQTYAGIRENHTLEENTVRRKNVVYDAKHPRARTTTKRITAENESVSLTRLAPRTGARNVRFPHHLRRRYRHIRTPFGPL